eukprot:gene12463-13748_t
MADNFVFFLQSVVRGYHAYLSTYKLTLGEILVITPDPDAVMHDKYGMKYATKEEEPIVGHIPKHLSQLCFKFIEDGGELNAEVISKRFNAGNGMGVEVPVKLSFVGNKQYLERFRSKMISAIRAEEKLNSSASNEVVGIKLKIKFPTEIQRWGEDM